MFRALTTPRHDGTHAAAGPDRVLTSAVEEISKTFDGHIGHREQVVKLDPEVLHKLLLVLRLRDGVRVGLEEGEDGGRRAGGWREMAIALSTRILTWRAS